MNVTHLSRLDSPFGEDGRGLSLRIKKMRKKSKKRKKKVNLERVDICSVLPYPFKLES